MPGATELLGNAERLILPNTRQLEEVQTVVIGILSRLRGLGQGRGQHTFRQRGNPMLPQQYGAPDCTKAEVPQGEDSQCRSDVEDVHGLTVL